jgi:hypothetical protein
MINIKNDFFWEKNRPNIISKTENSHIFVPQFLRLINKNFIWYNFIFSTLLKNINF